MPAQELIAEFLAAIWTTAVIRVICDASSPLTLDNGGPRAAALKADRS